MFHLQLLVHWGPAREFKLSKNRVSVEILWSLESCVTQRQAYHSASRGQIEMPAFMKLLGCPCKLVLLEGVPAVPHHLQRERVWKKLRLNRSPPQGTAFVYYKALMYEISAIIICK